jgi:hypothetical protein
MSRHRGPPRVSSCLSEGMQAAVVCHAEVVGELAALWVEVSSTAELVLGHSLDKTFQVEVVDELVVVFQRLDKLFLRLEHPGMRICALLLGPPLSQARWANRLDEVDGRLEAELGARREVDAELEALWDSATQAWGSVLDSIDGSSSLAASLSMVAELVEGWVNTVSTNGVH